MKIQIKFMVCLFAGMISIHSLAQSNNSSRVVTNQHASDQAAKRKVTQTTPIPANTVMALTGSVKITAADVMAEFVKLQPQQRLEVMAKPENVQQVANNLMVRRLLAQEATKDPLSNDPLIAAAIAIATDRILSDLRLQKLDEDNDPDAAAMEKYAKAKYLAERKRFETPEEVRASHILLDKGNEQQKDLAQKIMVELKAGAKFEELARIHSKDPGSAAKGGDLGFFGPGRMVKPFEAAVKKLAKPGDLSELVESQFGWHIIRLEERKPASVKPFEEVKEQLMNEARVALLSEGRVVKAQSLVQNITFEKDAIETFSKAARR